MPSNFRPYDADRMLKRGASDLHSSHRKYPTQNQLCIQLGESIRNLRHKNHLTQEALADMVSSTQKYISRMETGYARPSLELCLRIAIYTHAFDKNKKAASQIMQSSLEI